jgi:ssDNA-specific exonuclease RecJ
LTKGKPKKDKSFQEVVKEFDRYVHDPDQFHKIFSELGFSYVDDGWMAVAMAAKRRPLARSTQK